MAVRRRGSSLGRRPTPSSQFEQAAASAPTVPQTVKEPVWSLTPWSIEIPLGNSTTLEIPPLYAADWLEYLLDETPDIDGMIVNLMPDLDDYVFDNELPITTLYRIGLEALQLAAGRPWWIALRLITCVTGAWHILGPKLMMSGVDATNVSLSAWLDAALYIAIESIDPKKAMMFSMQLEAPPPPGLYGIIPEDPQEHEMTMDRNTFLALG